MSDIDKKYIRINNELILVKEEVYVAYYKMERQERTLKEKENRNHVCSYDEWDNDYSNGKDCLVDHESLNPQEIAIANIMKAKLHNCLEQLPDAERDLIQALFFNQKTVIEVADELKVPRSTLRDWRDRVLRKLKKMMESEK